MTSLAPYNRLKGISKILLLQTLLWYMSLHIIVQIQEIFLAVNMLGQRVCIFYILKDIVKLPSREVVPIYT